MSDKKLAIITGASRGIGRAVALNFAKRGYDVALLARSQIPLENVKKEIEDNYGVKVGAFLVDISQLSDIKSCMDHIFSHHSRVDVLFNNAGIYVGGLVDVAEEDLNRLIQTNIMGAYHMIQMVADKMKAQQSGYIFNVSSKSGKRAKAEHGVYAMSKFAVTGLSEALYNDMMTHGVKVTALCPGVIDTDMTRNGRLKDSDKITLKDIVTTVNYLLDLGPNACVKEVCIDCRQMVLGC